MGYELIVPSKASLSISLDFTNPSPTVPSTPKVSLWQFAAVAYLLLAWKRRFLKKRINLEQPTVVSNTELAATEEEQMAEVFDSQPRSYSYRKCALIGKGSCSQVFRAVKVKSGIQNPALLQCANQVVALKEMLTPSKSEFYKEAFIEEVKILKTLDHENCIGFFEAIWETGQENPWIVMEYADCGDLTDLMFRVQLREDHMATFCKEVSVHRDFHQPERMYSRVVERKIIDHGRLPKDLSISTARASCIAI